MKPSRSMHKAVTGLVLVTFCFFCLIVAPAQAAMVGTAAILDPPQNDAARQKVKSFLERQDVARHLQAWGVNPDEAGARVNALSDAEIALLSGRIDQLPAGGDALAVLLVVSFMVFITLLITDLTGVTDVFTFIKKR